MISGPPRPSTRRARGRIWRLQPAGAVERFAPEAAKVGIFRAGDWHLLDMQSGAIEFIPNDGDSRTDIAVYRPSEGSFYVRHWNDGSNQRFAFGAGPGDIPVSARYDSRFSVLAYFRPLAGDWTTRNIFRDDSTAVVRNFGPEPGDVPVPADYDGDGVADMAIFRPGGQWFIRLSSTSQILYVPNFGPEPGDKPVPLYMSR